MDTATTAEEMVRQITRIPDDVGAHACFGTPIERDGKVVIPVARVSFGFGLGFGRGAGSNTKPGRNGDMTDDGGEGEGGGGGGGGGSTPVAVITISGDTVTIDPIVDRTRIALGWCTMAGWTVFWLTWTARTVARERAKTRRYEIEKA